MEELEQGQGENLVVVYRAVDEFTAGIVRDLLAGENIPVVLESRQVPWLDGTMTMGEGYWGDVVVPREHADAAKSIIEGYYSRAEVSDNEVESGDGDSQQ